MTIRLIVFNYFQCSLKCHFLKFYSTFLLHFFKVGSLFTFNRFLEASVTGLLETQPPSVRISAVRAVFGFCEQLKVSESTSILLPFLEPILNGLVQLATQYGQDILALVLETIAVVLTVGLMNICDFCQCYHLL